VSVQSTSGSSVAGRPGRSFDIADHPVPTGREEEWRFTPVATFKPVFDDVPGEADIDWRVSAPDEVSIDRLSGAEAADLVASAPVDRPSALAVAHCASTLVVTVPAHAAPADPVRIGVEGDGRQMWGHLLVVLGERSVSRVQLEHSGSGVLGESVSIVAGDGAHVDVVIVQNWDDDAVHAGHIAVRAGRDSTVRLHTISLGGRAVRLHHTVDYAAPGGDVELNGLFFADGDQHLEHRILVDHAAPHCRSRVTYKGALQREGAHAVWIGDVVIRAAGVGTDTYELNRNLVLSDGTRVDSVPNLEIETGEVSGAGHASATGRFDQDQLFYLMSRGIPADEARQLVVAGFFDELLTKLDDADLRGRLTARLEAALGRVDA
jgi:Fe-S cluster assembly protein SufD